MLRVRKGYDVDYYLDAAVAKGREGYYTDAVAAGEPPGLWYGRGAEALGLVGEVDPMMMKALYTHGLDPRDPATRRPGVVGRGGAVRQPAAELPDRGGDLRPAAGAAPRGRAGGAGRAAGRRPGRRRGSRCRSTTWCCRRRSRTRCCGWPASAPPATPPRPATTRPRPSTRRRREGAGGGVDGRAPGDAGLPGREGRLRPRRASRRRRRPVGRCARLDRPRSSCSTTPATTTRSCTCTARPRTRPCAPTGRSAPWTSR